MEGPHDPQRPAHDAGAPQAAGHDDDLHALLERLLGQGDVPSVASGSDDLWPDLTAAPPDDVSTIVPAPDAPAFGVPAGSEPEAGDAQPARAWDAVAAGSGTSTDLDDIHAAILASVSLELEPVATPGSPAEAPAASQFAASDPELPVSADLLVADALAGEAVVDLSPPPSEPAPDGEPETLAVAESPAGTVEELFAVDGDAADGGAFQAFAYADVADAGTIELPAAAIGEDGLTDTVAPFSLTPFEAVIEPEVGDDDTDALWAAALPPAGLDAPLPLDLDDVAELALDVPLPLDLDSDGEPADELPAPPTAVVLPWPTPEPKAEPPAAAPADLIEAALAGVTADLTTEPVEPLRTPEVAASTAHVVFRLGARVLAVPLAAVSEIARPPKVTRLPHVPAWVLGIANLRGDIVSILDLEGFLSGKAGRGSHEQRMLALRPVGDEVRTAVLVDSVDGIQAFEDARIARVTRGFDAEVAPYARGLYQTEHELVVVLDADRLLQSKPMRQFEDGAGAR